MWKLLKTCNQTTYPIDFLHNFQLFIVKENENIEIFLNRLTLLLLNTTCPVLANSVDPNQMASEEANWSGSALFVIKYVNFYQKTWIK